jgi:hypothetical protein
MDWRDLEALFKGVIRTLAQAGIFGKRVTGIADGTDLETTEHYAGCGQATRRRRIEDKGGRVHEIEVTVYGWKVRLWIDAVTKMPLAVKVVKIHEHEALWTRALVTRPGPIWPALPACTKGSLTRVFWRGPTCGGWTSAASSWWSLPKTTWP